MSHQSCLGLQGFARRHIAVAVGLALSAAAANAQSATEEAKTLPKVSVAAAEPEETPKVDRVSSPKFTQDLIDTPQTIAIVSKEVLQQQGATTLSQALRNTPGVTFLLGENGNTATGDSIFMRGFDTQGSHLHRWHPRSRHASRATPSTPSRWKSPRGRRVRTTVAAPHRVTSILRARCPPPKVSRAGSASYGTANNSRITGDINHEFGDSGTALRLNVMGQDGDVDGRDFIERKGWAVAPSLAFGVEWRDALVLLSTAHRAGQRTRRRRDAPSDSMASMTPTSIPARPMPA